MKRWAWRHRALRSLGWRLVGLFVVLALAISLVFVIGMQRALHAGWTSVGQPLAADYVDRLIAEIGSPPQPGKALALAERLPVSVRIEGPLVSYETPTLRPPWLHRHDSDEHGEWLLSRSTADGHRITFGLGGVAWEQRPRFIGWLTLLALLLMTAAAYHVVRRLFRPLDDIRAGALRFGQGDFATPIPVRRSDELGDLANQVNTMAAELHRMLDAKRALLLAISHELRSPLTRARLNAELVAEGPERDALLRDLGQMRDLITDLLESERLASGHAALQREAVDLNALVREVTEHLPVTLSLDSGLPTLWLDRARIRLLLRNLLDNALRHGAGPTPPLLRISTGDAQVQIEVRDQGPGVDPALLAQLAEAFYRPDAARTRDAGGVGLGLHLCRLVAQAHGGQMQCLNATPGLAVIVSLPLEL